MFIKTNEKPLKSYCGVETPIIQLDVNHINKNINSLKEKRVIFSLFFFFI